ncbi:MAG TPA: radical SAM protein, partial [Candidatus Wirthbacteria bacterium]|nr:radical SAM protein [Candidatus Wirthbacteria bacterium]
LRVTGGEPTVRKDLPQLIELLAKIKGIEEIGLTTNGSDLLKNAEVYQKAGIDRVNISLNTLQPERYKKITDGHDLEPVLQGLERCLEIGWIPVKLNVILFKGINDDELFDFVRLSLNQPISVRFIEFFCTSERFLELKRQFVPNPETQERIEQEFGKLENDPKTPTNGPADNFKIPGSTGSIGFISTETNPFCPTCNRLRLTADGKLLPCLFSHHHLDIKELLRLGKSDLEIQVALDSLFIDKDIIHRDLQKLHEFEMSGIGG